MMAVDRASVSILAFNKIEGRIVFAIVAVELYDLNQCLKTSSW